MSGYMPIKKITFIKTLLISISFASSMAYGNKLGDTDTIIARDVNAQQARVLQNSLQELDSATVEFRIRKRPDMLMQEWDALIDESMDQLTENPLSKSIDKIGELTFEVVVDNETQQPSNSLFRIRKRPDMLLQEWEGLIDDHLKSLRKANDFSDQDWNELVEVTFFIRIRKRPDTLMQEWDALIDQSVELLQQPKDSDGREKYYESSVAYHFGDFSSADGEDVSRGTQVQLRIIKRPDLLTQEWNAVIDESLEMIYDNPLALTNDQFNGQAQAFIRLRKRPDLLMQEWNDDFLEQSVAIEIPIFSAIESKATY